MVALQGSMTKGTEKTGNVPIKYFAKTNLTFLTLPVLFSFTPRPEWGLVIGPELNYLLTAKEPWYKSEIYKPDDYQVNIKDKYKDFTPGLAIGFNYLIDNGIILQFRYTNSIISVIKSEYGTARSYSVMFSVGVNLSGR